MGILIRLGYRPSAGMFFEAAACLVLMAVASSVCNAQVLPSLPLQVVFTTPPDLLTATNPSITLSGRDTITAVFSRPVIALGSDFGQAALPAGLTPFSIKCDTANGTVLGDVRWVTSNIARFDPRDSWPTDLTCSFEWNKQLKTFDGVPLKLPANAGGKLTLSTNSLVITVLDVASALGNNLTKNQYSAYRGMPDDNFPEYLPGANVTLLFNFPVHFSLLQAALQTSACCNSSAGASQTIKVLPCPPPFFIRPFFGPAANRSPVNGTCAVLQLTPGIPAPSRASSPPLVQGGLKLSLPTGARYSQAAGTFKSQPLNIYLWGPRRFRIPLRQNFEQLANATQDFAYPDNGISYRRMTLWLPLGLAKGVTAAQMGAQMSLCKYDKPYDWYTPCKPIKFYLDLVNQGQMLMTVPSFMPREHYKLLVKGTDQIRDGLGSPLEGSEAYFFTTDPSADMQTPGVASGGRLILLEKPVQPPQFPWPVVMRGKPQYAYNSAKVSTWNVSVDALPDILSALRRDSKKLPTPRQSVVRRNTTLARFEPLTMISSPLQLVATFDQFGGIQGWNFLAQSQLQFASVILQYKLQAWVTQVNSAAPVAGAKLTTLLYTYNDKVLNGPSCTTDATGACQLDMKPALEKIDTGLSEMYLLVQSGSDTLLVVGNFNFPYIDRYSQPSKYQATLVLDRQLVRPGEKLAITGYVQAKNGSRLSLPSGLTTMSGLITPGFTEGDYKPVSFNVTLDPVYGSFHTTVTVPVTAPLISNDVQLLVPGTTDRNTLATQQITIADPRPPTAFINITTPDWAPPNSTVKVHIKALSYIGADVSNANMVLTWSVPLSLNTINITTNASGDADVAIPLGGLPPQNATKLGDVLNLEVSWVGPTRELIKQLKTVRLEQGPVRSVLRLSPQTQVPGIPFTVAAENYINDEFNTRIEGVTVGVSLVLRNASTANCTADQLGSLERQRCTVVSGKAPGTLPCLLQLPCAAEFTLRACATKFANGTAVVGAAGKAPCSESPIGFNRTTWNANPWSSPPTLRLLVAKANQTLGSDVEMFYVNPYWGKASGMLVWGNAEQQKRRNLGTVSPGFQRVTLRIGDECRGGCWAALVLSVARQARSAGDLTGSAAVPSTQLLPRSKLFDPWAPLSPSSIIRLQIQEDNFVTVNITAKGVGVTAQGDPVLRPLGPGELKVLVKDGITGAPVPNAEVTLMVTDRANLDLLPYPLIDLAYVMRPTTDVSCGAVDLNSARTSLINLNTTMNTLQARLQADPWLPLVTTISNSQPIDQGDWGSLPSRPATSPVDIPLDIYLKQFTSPVTTTPFYSWGLSQRYPGGSGGGASDPSAALRLAKEFQTTPVFKWVTTNAEGVASLKIKAPGNLGAFTVRAYVVNKGATSAPSKYGSNETQLVVRNPLSVTPSVPRQVRMGDVFHAGVIVTIPGAIGDEPVTVTARVVRNATLAPALELVEATDGSSSLEVTITAEQTSREARFGFKTLGVGTAVVQFSAKTASGQDQDGVEIEIPVLGRQGSVYLGTSFAVEAASGGAQQKEGLDIPPAEPNTGAIVLSAGVGYLPASKTLYAQLVQQQQQVKNVEDLGGATTVSTAVLPPILLQYGSPSLVSSSQLNASNIAARTAAKPLTRQDLGLMWFKPTDSGLSYLQPDVQLNSWATWVVGQTSDMAKATNDKTIQAYYGTLKQAASSSWQPVIGPQLTRQAVQALTPLTITDASGKKMQAKYSDWESLSWARLVLGAGWSPSGPTFTNAPGDTQKAVQQALSLSGLIAAATTPGNTSVGTQARTGLLLLSELRKGGATATATANSYKAAAEKLSTQLQGAMRVSGRVGYIAGRPGAAWAAGADEQALGLFFLQQQSPKAPLLQKLAAYVAGGQVSGVAAYCPVPGGTSAALTALALAGYDKMRGSTQPQLVLTATASREPAAATSKPFQLLKANFTAANAGSIATSNTSYTKVSAALGGQPNRATFSAVGKGEVSVAVGLDFTPATLLPFPSYRGIWVDSVIQDETGNGRLLTATFASIVTVAVQLTTPDDLGAVVVEVRMPGGLEPVDPNVYRDAASALTCSNSGRWYWWWCPSQQTSPSLVKFSFSQLSAGTVSLKFKAVTATAGRFVLPPVKAFAVQQPEVMGLSAAGNFSVCPVKKPGATDAAPVAGQTPVPGCSSSSGAAPGAPLPVPKACPQDCNKSGICNFSSGSCICNQGFTGAACDKAAAS